MLDVNAIYVFLKKNLMSKRGLALVIALGCILFAYNTVTSRVIPMAYGSGTEAPVGAEATDLVATAISVLTALVSFVASNYLGVKPEIIQAVVAFEKDKTNVDNQRRLGAAVIGYLVSVIDTHPEGFVMTLLTTLVSSVDDPATKDVLKNAAAGLAANEFKVVSKVSMAPSVQMGAIQLPQVIPTQPLPVVQPVA